MKNITKTELQDQFKQQNDIYLIDVREEAEHVEFNIGGIHLPLGKIQSMEIDTIEHLRQKKVVCYCRSGARSGTACLFLSQFGFTDVSNLVGGMLEWQR